MGNVRQGDGATSVLLGDAGDSRLTIETLVLDHGGDLANYARRRGATDPEGLANEVFLRFFTRSPELAFGNRAMVRAYLFRTARNLVSDEYRRRAARPNELLASVSGSDEHRAEVPGALHSPALAESFEHRVDDGLQIDELLSELDADQEQVLRLRYLSDLSIEETARRLDKPVGTVKSLQHHAIRALRALVLAGAVIAVMVMAILALRRVETPTSLQPITSNSGESEVRSAEGNRDGSQAVSDGSVIGGELAPSIQRQLAGSLPTPGIVAAEGDAGDGIDGGATSPTSLAARGSAPTASAPSASAAAAPTSSPTVGRPDAGLVGAGDGPSTSSSTTSTTVVPAAPATSAISGSEVTSTAVPTTSSPSSTSTTAAPRSFSGPVVIRSVATSGYLWVATSDFTVRSNGSSPTAAKARFTVIALDETTIALAADDGARLQRIGVQNDADNTLRARGGDGERPVLLAHLQRDGTYRFESATFPGRYLRVDGATIDSGGTLTSGDETRFELISR